MGGSSAVSLGLLVAAWVIVGAALFGIRALMVRRKKAQWHTQAASASPVLEELARQWNTTVTSVTDPDGTRGWPQYGTVRVPWTGGRIEVSAWGDMTQTRYPAGNMVITGSTNPTILRIRIVSATPIPDPNRVAEQLHRRPGLITSLDGFRIGGRSLRAVSVTATETVVTYRPNQHFGLDVAHGGDPATIAHEVATVRAIVMEATHPPA